MENLEAVIKIGSKEVNLVKKIHYENWLEDPDHF